MHSRKLSVVGIGALFIFLVGAVGGCDKFKQSKVKRLPVDTNVTEGDLTFTVWDQQLLPGSADEYVGMVEVYFPGKNKDTLTLQSLSLKLVKENKNEEVKEDKNLAVEKGGRIFKKFSWKDSKLAELIIQASESSGKSYGPLHFTFAQGKADVEGKKGGDDALDYTPLGYLYSIVPTETPAVKGKRMFVVSFRGRGVLNFRKEDFKMGDSKSNNTYEWSCWLYDGDIVSAPGSIDGVPVCGTANPVSGPVVLGGRWDFSAVYLVPENVTELKVDFRK